MPERGALLIVCLIAGALILWPAMEIGLYAVICMHKKVPVEILPCVIKSIPAVIGLVILIKAKAVAGWISDKLDE